MRSFLIILLLMCTGAVSYSQEIIEVIQIEKDEGLKDRTVDRIIRDDQGYFIVCLKNAVQRYDGKEFTNIDISAIKSQNIEVRDFTMVDKLLDGKIVMYTAGIDMLFYLDAKAKSISTAPIRGIPIVNNGELFLLEDSGSQTKEKRFVLNKGTLDKTITQEVVSAADLPSDINRIAYLDNTFYVSTTNNSIFHVENEVVSKLEVQGKVVQRPNGIYIFDDSAIYKITGKKTSKVTDLWDRSFKCNIIKLDQKDNIIAAYKGRDKFHDRLYILDKNDSLHVMENILGVSEVFKDFHTDDAFYRWMLGGYNGIHVINLMREGSTSIFKRPTVNKGEFGVVVSGVATDGEDEVIFARELISMFSYDKSKDDYEEILTSYTDKGDFERNSKLYYHSGSKAYYSHGYRYDGMSDVYKFVVKNESARKHTLPLKLNDIYVRDKDDLIVGGFITKTDTGIIASYNLKTEEYNIIRKQAPQVRSIYFDEIHRRYWIGTYKGLMIFDESFTLLKTLSKNSDVPYRMPIDHIVMCERFNDKILAGSYGGGLYIIDPVTYSIDSHLSEENGLIDNNAIGIINDDLGNCWVTTFNGVNVINKDFKIIKKIYEFDGLPNREFNSKAIAKDGDGIIYAGTLNGVSKLDPSKVLKWEKSYGVDIDRVIGYIGDNVDRLGFTDELILLEPYDSIQILYNLPDYHIYPYVENNIKVFAKDLNVTLADKIVTVRNIVPGDYILKLGENDSNIESSLKIVRKRNYQKYLYSILSILAFAILAYIISRKIITSTKRREEEKTKLNKRISDLQLTSLQSQMNPHFIFNALGAVQYFIQTHDTEKADEYLSNFAMLMRSILESSKSKYIRLNEELRLLELYVGLEKVRFENLFEYDIKIDVNVDTEINIPPMIVQPFVENAINHGLYNLSGREGYLLIHFSMPEEDLLVISIKDNGVGRQRAGELRMKKHKSRGTQIVQERLETINNGQELAVTTETVDLMVNGKSMGTKVVITIDARV